MMKKISIVIKCNGNITNIEKCFNSLINQSYKDIEILALVSKKSNGIFELLGKLSEKDDRIRVVNNINDKNDLSSSIICSQKATGDYISIINCDDYIDFDYYRLLVEKAESDNCDIVIGNYVKKTKTEENVFGLSFNTNNKNYGKEDYYDLFLKQSGRDIRHYKMCLKLINMKLWKKISDCVIQNKYINSYFGDYTLSVISHYYANKTGFCDNAVYYNVYDKFESLDNNNISVEMIDDSINCIKKEFDIIKDFFQKQKIYQKYKEFIIMWKSFCLMEYINIYKKYKEKNTNIDKLKFDYENDSEINKYIKQTQLDKSWYNYCGLKTQFDSGLSKIKEIIMDDSVKIVSFDMFDTLVNRPFFKPSDMFKLLNKDFLEIFSSIKAIDFSKIRIYSEAMLREIKAEKGIPEVTLDEIYDYMANTYNLDKNKLEILKSKEMEMEYHFSGRRETGYELYKFAKFLNKKVILTSDIYLPKDLIVKLLNKNDYEFDELYISSELMKSKGKGDMFQHIIDNEKTTEILHIGDNIYSDYQKPLEYNLKSAILYKAIDVMMGKTDKNVGYCGELHKKFVSFNHDHLTYLEIFGVRCSLAIVANYYFDNPFRPFNSWTEFNGDPYFIGYYALGMQSMALSSWLLEDAANNKIDSISFMARDGYLPFKTSTILKSSNKNYKNIELNYIYVSRKSLMPLLLRDKSGLSMIETYLNYKTITPNDVIKQFTSVFRCNSKIENELKRKIHLNKKFETQREFNEALSLIYDKCFDAEKYNNYYEICKKYFSDNYSGNASTFDIGYSGKPEAIISSIINKPVTTYFIHINNSNAFNNSTNSNSKLKVFYDYKPTLTGTIRELFISSTAQSCIGYEYDNDRVVPIFSKKEKYTSYNLDMINKIQNGAIDFVKDFLKMFGDYISLIDLNKYYMSIPFEYYCHYAQFGDRLPTSSILFEDNVNNYIEMNDYMYNMYNNYAKDYCLGKIPNEKEDFTNIMIDKSLLKSKKYAQLDQEINETNKNEKVDVDLINYQLSLPKSRIKRVLYYLLYDRETLKKKIFKNKK